MISKLWLPGGQERLSAKQFFIKMHKQLKNHYKKLTGKKREVLLVPPLFLLDSGHSGGIWWSRIWQEGLLIFSFRCILSPAEFGHSGIETGMVPRLTGTECNRNPVVCLAFVCLAIIFTPVTKHKHNTLSSHHQPPTHRCRSSLLPHVVSTHHGLNDV